MNTEDKLKFIKNKLKTNLFRLLVKRAFVLGYLTEPEKNKLDLLFSKIDFYFNFYAKENIIFINILYNKIKGDNL